MKTQILLSVILVSVLSLAPIFTGAIYTGSDATPSPDGVLTDNAIIVLKDQPLASYDGHIQGYARTMPTPGHKLDMSSQAVQSYSAYLANGRGLAKGWLKNNAPEVQVIDEYSIVLNAIAVQLNGHSMTHLLNAPGANWVVPDYLFHLEMNRSPTLIGAPVLWNAVGGQSNAGAGVKIGIIDTGIDQTHPFLTDNTLPALAGFPKCDAIDSAVGTAVADGMDVLNLSLGGGARPSDVLVNAVNSAVDAGVVVAIAAGNAGPAPGTVESPGIADKVITVGASTNPHFIGIPVTVTSIGTFGAAIGQFANFVPAVTSTYVTTSPTNGCTSISGSLSGEIALIARGACSFSTKIRNAQSAGATGVIVYNSQQGDPVAMAQDGTPNQPTIPAVMVSRPNGLAMAAIAPSSVTVDGTTPQEFFTDGPSADILAAFSSIGPPLLQVPGVGVGQPQDKIKPDVVAPGVNVYSSIPSFGCASPPCFAFFQGTSMATPHVAGSAALLIQLHPNWSPEQIKSALVNSAHRPVKSFSTGNPLKNPMVRGGGRIDLAAASQVTATLEAGSGDGQASFSFGVLPSSGITRSFDITVTSVSTSTVTYSVSVLAAAAGPTISLSVTSLTLAAGGTGTVTVSLTLSSTLPSADYFGDIQLTGGTIALSLPYWVRADPPGSGGLGSHAPLKL